MAIAPLVSKDTQQIGRLIIFDDITDRAELEQPPGAGRQAQLALACWPPGVAHEVNTPLAVISTYAQMLAKQVSGDEQKSQLLEKIAKQTFRASEIVNSLLNFSRTSSTEFADVDLNRVIRETLGAASSTSLRKPASIRRSSLAPALPLIHGNAGKTAAGVPESVPERSRRHAGRRRAGRPDLGRRRRPSRGSRRHRAWASRPSTWPASTIRSSPPRRPRRVPASDLSVTYGIVQRTRRYHRGVEPGRRRHAVLIELPLAEGPAAPCRSAETA